jgi:hypothetical protein
VNAHNHPPPFADFSDPFVHRRPIPRFGEGDERPSFFFAKTMKYLYLHFMEEPAHTPMDLVFSTEAHPFKR